MRILVFEPMRMPYVKDIENSLRNLQEEVNADTFQAVYPFDDPIALVCDENGKYKPTNRPNRVLRDADGRVYDVLVGKFFLCGIANYNFASLSDEMIKKYSSWRPEIIMGSLEALLVIPFNGE